MTDRSSARTCLLFAAVAWGIAGNAAGQHIEIGPNVHVSSARSGNANYEVIAAADPNDASRLLVGAIERRVGTAGTTAYVSHDGGETWSATLDAPPRGREQGASSDPDVMFDSRGTAYFVTSLLPPNSSGPTRSMLLYRSGDGGKSWRGPVYFTYSDREYIAIDETGGPYDGRIYCSGNSRVGVTARHATLFYSTDGGETFTEARVPGMPVSPVMGNLVVLSDGAVVVLHSAAREIAGEAPPDEVPAWLRVNFSNDGGETLSEPVNVAPATLVPGRKGAHNNSIHLPLMAVDASDGPYRDRLYVVWPEMTGGHTEIFLTRSEDGGKTWSPPRQVSDSPAPAAGASPTDQFMATVAVNNEGIVGVLWFDRRDCPDNIGWDVRFTASLDGGDTFLPSVKVSEVGNRFDGSERWIVGASASRMDEGAFRLDVSLDTFTFLGGDTAGLAAAADGRFHAVWVDNSTGTPQAWTAPVTVVRGARAGAGAGAGEGNASGTLSGAVRKGESGLADVTKVVDLEIVDTWHDRRRNVLQVRVRIVNSSDRALAGPFLLRLEGTQSELGTPVAANADRLGTDVVEWEIELPSGSLAPGERTLIRRLVFALKDIGPYRQGDRYVRGLVRGTVTILAPGTAGKPELQAGSAETRNGEPDVMEPGPSKAGSGDAGGASEPSWRRLSGRPALDDGIWAQLVGNEQGVSDRGRPERRVREAESDELSVAESDGAGRVRNSGGGEQGANDEVTAGGQLSDVLTNLRFNGLIQGWFVAATGPAVDTFRLRRAEMKLSANLGSTASWVLMIDPSKSLSINREWVDVEGAPVLADASLNQASRMLQDAYISVAATPAVSVSVGQFKLPLGYEGLQSSAALGTVERALFLTDRARGARFGDVRDLGAMVKGRAGGSIDFQAGFFNGDGATQNDLGRPESKMAVGRLVARVPHLPGLSMGVSAGRGVEGGSDARRERTGFDAQYVRDALTLAAEVIGGRDADTRRLGYYLHAGYRIAPPLEVVVRFDTWDPDRSSDSTPETVAERDYLAGVNYLFPNSTLKWQLNIVRKTFVTPAVPARTQFVTNLQVSW